MFKPNEIFQDTYLIRQEIGRGGVGQIYLAYHLRLRKNVVIKQIRSDFVGVVSSRAEVDILKNLHHSNLPQVYDFLQLGPEVYTVMDYIEGQNLDVVIRQNRHPGEKTLVSWLRQLLDVLDYLHTRKVPVIHSDIKPGNIILRPDGSVCLIDFNISLDGMEKGKIVGYSAYYAAPEQVRLAQAKQMGRPCNIRLDARTDLYSLAATFYHLVTGHRPVTGRPNPPMRQLAEGRYTPDFLEILDRAMSPEPGKRWHSARQMRAAVNRLRRKDNGYRAYMAMQVVSWVMSALLLGTGVFCVLRGVSAEQSEAYRADYLTLSEAIQNEDDSLVLQTGNQILNRDAYQSILEQSPEDCSAILHAMGDSCYHLGDYAAAASYYQQALDCADSGDAQLGCYYCDAALALMKSGNVSAASEILAQAQAAGLSGGQQLLVQAAVALVEADSDACVTAVRQLIATESDSELCEQACLLAVRAVTGQEQLEWLQIADGFYRTRQTLRQMGALCMELANEAESTEDGERYCRQALEYYQVLADDAYATLEDRLNLGIVQLSLEDTASCISTLLELEQEYPDDYRIEMYLAFAYYRCEDLVNASTYCGSAWRHWNNATELERQSADEREIENLRELWQKLNF